MGKTFLLKELLRLAPLLLPHKDKLIRGYIDYSIGQFQDVLPSTYINDLICDSKSSVDKKQWQDPIHFIEDRLEVLDKYIFLVVDEFQFAYTAQCKSNGRAIISEISAIGGTSKGRIHCIISGSSSVLRKLAFAKLEKKAEGDYPNYAGLDLNSTKFCAKSIYPFLEQETFTKVVAVHSNGDQKTSSINHGDLFIRTGGNPGLLADVLIDIEDNRKVDNFSSSLNKSSIQKEGAEMELLQTIFSCLRNTQQRDIEHEPELLNLTQWTRLIPYEVVLQTLTDEHKSQPLSSTLYNLADNNVIRYQDGRPSLIGLASPTIYLQLFQLSTPLRGKIQLWDLYSLTFPNGCVSQSMAAERTAMKCLAASSSKWLKLSLDDDHNVYELYLPSEDPNNGRTHTTTSVHYDYSIPPGSDPDDFKLRICKELYFRGGSYSRGRDAFGADAVILECRDGESWIAHRLQIKLGTLQLKEEHIQEIANNIKRNQKNVLEAYKCAGIVLAAQLFYLVTTRPYQPQTMTDVIQQYGIDLRIINAKELTTSVWTEEIKSLGKPYS